MNRRFSFSARLASLLASCLLGLLPTATLEASRALPRVTAASENIRLAIPHALAETSEQGAMGLDFDEPIAREAALDTTARYIQMRRQPRLRSQFALDCESKPAGVMAIFCAIEVDRALEPSKRQEAGNLKSPQTHAERRAERRDVADQLMAEQWSSVTDIPYQNVVGIVGAFKNKSDLLQMGRALGAKSECVGAKAATAIAYKLEEHFPDADAIAVARSLYSYASGCGTDFAAAKAAYRLALLDVWQNQCGRVPELMLKVEQNADSAQFRSRAKYWRAHCSEVLGQHEASREARESLFFDYPMTFQNLAANSDATKAIDGIIRNAQVPIAFRSLVRPEMNDLILAIEALVKLKAIDLASDLVDRSIPSIQQFEPEVRLFLAALMHKHDQVLPKFKILASLFQDSPGQTNSATMKLYFPMWFFEFIGPSSGTTLDPLLVMALIRQESAFNTRARSRVGARGLMQLMPATAKMLAPIRTNKLFDPATNIALGTQYLRKRLSQYNGDVELTLAAYNAGFSRVDDWKKRYPTDNRILFLDLIPFRETREYVSAILRNYYWYTKLYGRKIERKIAADDLSLTFQAITRAQSGLVTAPAAAPPVVPTEPNSSVN